MEPASNLNYDSPILNKLNDVCLKKVFQFLHLRDLCNVADVSKRFKHNAQQIFKSVDANLDILKLIEGNKDYHNEWFMVQWLTEKFLKCAEQLLRNFGPFIQGLHLTGTNEMGGMDENELLILVKTYCPSLKELTLRDIGRHDRFNSTELIPLFGGLEKLSVFAEDVSDTFVEILSDCHNLKYLNVGHVPAPMWMKHKFPKLETLVISSNWEFEYTDFESFLKFHENLRTLRYDDDYIASCFFAILSKASLKLETFHCKFDAFFDYDEDEEWEEVEENILQLSKLKSLRNLTFTCDASTINLLVDAFEKEETPIEHLEILDCQIDSELIDGLSKLKWLKTLQMTRCEIDKETLININKCLNRLIVMIKDIKGFDLDHHLTKISLAENVCVVNSNSKTFIRKMPNLDQNLTNILSILNDDCLVEIFELLPLRDLCNVADVCKRFQQNAQTAFQLHHICFKISELAKTDENGSHTDLQMAEQLFRNFGFFIQELSLQGRCLKNNIEQQTIMYLATKYCISMSFKTLTLNGIHIDCEMQWLIPLLDLFHHLPKLELHSCRLNAAFGKFISICRIPTIQVYSLRGSTEWMNYTFWYLRQMILLETWQPESTMIEFIKLNGHLQSFVIHQSILSSQIFKTVAQHMPKLQAFCFAGKNPRDRKISKNVLHLSKLKNLEQLTLNCSSFSVTNLIDEFSKASVQISQLNICFGTFDMELLEKMCNLKSSLKSLQLRRVKIENVSLIDVVKQLPDLEELVVDIKGIGINHIILMLPFAKKLTKLQIGSERSHVKIDIVNYELILEIVKSREKAKNLCIHITNENRHVFVPQHLLQENSYWLKVENEIIENLSLIMSDSDSDRELQDSDSSVEESDDGSVMSVEGSDDSVEDLDDDAVEDSDDDSVEDSDDDAVEDSDDDAVEDSDDDAVEDSDDAVQGSDDDAIDMEIV